jgi:hypothetical protein
MASVIWKSNDTSIEFDSSLEGFIPHNNSKGSIGSWSIALFSETDQNGFFAIVQPPLPVNPLNSYKSEFSNLFFNYEWIKSVKSWKVCWSIKESSQFTPYVKIQKRFYAFTTSGEGSFPERLEFCSEILSSIGEPSVFSTGIIYSLSGNFNNPVDFTLQDEIIEFEIGKNL